MHIQRDDLQGQAIQNLLIAHRQSMFAHSPAESVHALDLDALRLPSIYFWSAWEQNELKGCGALKILDPHHGEIKSMRTVTQYLGQGVASAILAHIIENARALSLHRLYLETGTAAAFAPAKRLYERFGFTYTTPFADYLADPYSVFMTKSL